MDNFQTTIFKILGYFPFSMVDNQILFEYSTKCISSPPQLPTHRWKILYSRYFNRLSSTLSIIPTLFYTLVTFLIIVPLITLQRENHTSKSAESVHSIQRYAKTSTFYVTWNFKSAIHLFCASFVKIGMFLNRKCMHGLLTEIQILSKSLRTISGKNYRNSNKFTKELLIQLIIFLGFITCGIFEVGLVTWHQLGITPAKFFARVTPTTIGYLHSVFSLVVLYYLNWYLELLLEIKVLIGLKFGEIVNSMKIDSMTEILTLYARLAEQVHLFNKTFRFWVIIDMIHSLTRIIISAYYIAIMAKNTVYTVSGLCHDGMTVTLYFYLIYAVCKRGLEIEEESAEIVRKLEVILRWMDRTVFKYYVYTLENNVAVLKSKCSLNFVLNKPY